MYTVQGYTQRIRQMYTVQGYTQRIRQMYEHSRAAVVHLNFRAGSTFPVPVCTVTPRHWVANTE